MTQLGKENQDIFEIGELRLKEITDFQIPATYNKASALEDAPNVCVIQIGVCRYSIKNVTDN